MFFCWDFLKGEYYLHGATVTQITTCTKCTIVLLAIRDFRFQDAKHYPPRNNRNSKISMFRMSYSIISDQRLQLFTFLSK